MWWLPFISRHAPSTAAYSLIPGPTAAFISFASHDTGSPQLWKDRHGDYSIRPDEGSLDPALVLDLDPVAVHLEKSPSNDRPSASIRTDCSAMNFAISSTVPPLRCGLELLDQDGLDLGFGPRCPTGRHSLR